MIFSWAHLMIEVWDGLWAMYIISEFLSCQLTVETVTEEPQSLFCSFGHRVFLNREEAHQIRWHLYLLLPSRIMPLTQRRALCENCPNEYVRTVLVCDCTRNSLKCPLQFSSQVSKYNSIINFLSFGFLGLHLWWRNT